MGVVFGSWPESLHTEFEQVKRIEAGRKLKKKIASFDVVSFNPDEQTLFIAGSATDPYECNLQTCTCADFKIRHLPCKHIYCLADALGLLADLPKYRKGSGSFDPAAEIERYRSLYEAGQISADAYVKVCTPLAKMAK